MGVHPCACEATAPQSPGDLRRSIRPKASGGEQKHLMTDDFTDAELLGYVDEALPAERMTAVESNLRHSKTLQQRLAVLCSSRDSTGPSVGEVWRRARLSCPSRARLGSYLLNALPRDWYDYVEFHVNTVGCRYCAANIADLQASATSPAASERRRQKFFQSSAGYVPRRGS